MLYFLFAQEQAAYGNADVRPTNHAPIISANNKERTALSAHWGFIPSWAKYEVIAQHTFTARAETLDEKPRFRAAFKRRDASCR